MQIEVIMRYYREEILVPLFMQHYAPWADKITLLTHKYPDNKLVEQTGLRLTNEAVQASKADWVVVVDADEFIFPKPYGTDPRAALAAETQAAFIFCEMPRVWRHENERDLDFLTPPVPQRVHGEPWQYHPMESKPCLFRPVPYMRVEVGAHTIHYPGGRQGRNWGGAHWQSADPCLGVRVTRDRKGRISDSDLAKGFSIHYQNVTQESFAGACYANARMPVIIDCL